MHRTQLWNSDGRSRIALSLQSKSVSARASDFAAARMPRIAFCEARGELDDAGSYG